MKLIPAIDLLDGRCVRLLHGDFDKVTHYPALPEDLARSYADAGAEWLHVVDLAASRDGADADNSALLKLLGQAPQSVQTGGGVRSEIDITTRLDAGAARVVIGSLCVTDTRSFIKWLESFGAEKLVAALDIRFDENGIPWPRIHGWTDQADRDMWQLLDELVAGGLLHLLCTDISRDGALFTCCVRTLVGMAHSMAPTWTFILKSPVDTLNCDCKPPAVSAVFLILRTC